MATLRYCTHPGCGVKVTGGRCPAHTQGEAQRPNQDVRRWYRTARWAALRQHKMNENPLCLDCYAFGHIEPWTDLDHRIPHRGDPALFWDPHNLEGRCHACHSAKTRRGQ